MALSQVQCLDDNHVNPRTHESKPEFLYCENQRLALEALLQDGRGAFLKCLEARGLRGFLSDPELETLARAVEPYDPGSDLFPENAEDDEPPLSLHYWPDLSDMSIPQMDLGWPDCDAYRGVTRTTVYSQPPLDGQTHIKEVVRKMIAQAQKVIAVVMDVFTDVDIFRDLLDAGFKRKVSVYILLEGTTLPHFLSMCQRANMHGGHLKHLRVRCTHGAEFYSRSSTKVRGQMEHRFMFVDGDKALSGSYSFTWISSRLNKSLITVVTGQAVEAFDRLYRTLYSTSTSVDLRQLATEPEPEPEPVPQLAAMTPISADIARKLFNPKYALVNFGNPSPSATADNSQQVEPQVNQNPQNSKNPEETNKRRRRRLSNQALQEAPPIHPGLANLEKACLISYLPIWPEPDPPKDVIGFINVIDTKKPTQVHLQRSEMFETSQAIRFSSPFNAPKETLPEVAMPRKLLVKSEEMTKVQPAQKTTKAEDQQNSKCQSSKEAAKTPNAPTKQQVGHNTTPHLSAQSSPKASTPNPGRPTHTPQTVNTNSRKPDSPVGSNTKKETSSITQSAEGNSTKTSHTKSNKEKHTQAQTVLPHIHSHTQAVHTQPQNSSEITSNIQTPTANGHVSSSSASTLSENNVNASSSSVPPLTSSSAALNQPLPTSSAACSSSPTLTPIPKPRTIQLLMKDGIPSDGKKLLECSAVKKPQGPIVVQNQSAIITAVQTLQDKQPEIVPELQNKSVTQKDSKSTVNIKEAPQEKESGTSQETKNEEAVGQHDDRKVPGTKLEARPNVSITEPLKAESVNTKEIIPKNAKAKTLTSIDSKLNAQVDGIERALIDPEFAEAPHENPRTVTNFEKAPELKTISDGVLAPKNKDVLETVDLTNAKQDTQSTFKEITNAREGKHTPEKSLRLPLSDTHTQDLRSLDGLSLRTPTPDSRTNTPDPRSYTPDFRTPTPDISDGYMSAFEDSNLSTTSEEFYECTSPCIFEAPFFDRAANSNHRITEDHSNSPNAATDKKFNSQSSSSEAQSLSGPENEVKKEEAKEERAKGGSQATERKGSKESKEKSKKVLNQSTAEKLVDGGLTPTEPKRSSTGAEREGTDKEKATFVARKDKPQPTRETKGQKLVQTPEGQQKESGASRPPQPFLAYQYSGPRPSGSHLLSKAENMVHHGGFQALDNTGAAGRRQTEVSRSQQSLFTQQSFADRLKPHASLLHAHSNSQPQLTSRFHNQTLSAQRKAPGPSPFSFTFSRLYSLKDLTDKMSQLPAQSKRGSTSFPIRKNMS